MSEPIIYASADLLPSPAAFGVGYAQILSGTKYYCDGSAWIALGSDGLPLLRNIGNRCCYNEQQGVTLPTIMSRSLHTNKSDLPQYSLQIMLHNFANAATAEAGTGSPATFTASIEYPAGNYNRVKFGGNNQGVVPNNGTLLSDLVTLSTPIPPNAQFYVRTWQSNPSGCIYTQYGGSNANNNTADGLNYGGTQADLVMGGTVNQIQAAYRPYAIVGLSNRPAWIMYGDSRNLGIGEGSGASAAGLCGYAERALGPYFATQKIGISSDTLAGFLGSHTNRLAAAKYATHILLQYNVNDDYNSSLNLAQMQNNVKSFIALFPGKKVYATTLEPETTSSNAWADQAGQTVTDVTKNGVRTAYNDSLRGNAITGLAGYIDIAAVLESTPNGGKWITNGTANYYVDNLGVHGSAAANALAGTPTVFNLFNL